MEDAKLRGGDSGMAYVGTHEMDCGLFTAQMSVTRHRTLPGVVSVLGYNDVMVEMIGRARDASAKLPPARARFRACSLARHCRTLWTAQRYDPLNFAMKPRSIQPLSW